MNSISIVGKQNFMGKEIPIVLGGFGKSKKSISDKVISEIHGQAEREIRRRITDNIKRFKENVDVIDLKKRVDESHTLKILIDLGYAKQSITQAEHIYILSERGYAKLIKIMDTDLAWEIHDNLMDEYFLMREGKQPIEQLSPQLQLLINLELKQKEQDAELSRLDSKIDSIKEVVALNPNDWRKDTGKIINKMAKISGGYEHIKVIREDSYKLLEQRMNVALNIRLTNKRKTMSLNGVCKSKIDKLNQLDVIADDKKLIEGYIAVIKDMAIKFGVADMEVA